MEVQATQSAAPFTPEGKYQGKVQTEIYIHQKTGSMFIRSIGDRLTLITFTEPYSKEFKERFGTELIGNDLSQIDQLTHVFSNLDTVKNYGSGKTKTRDEVVNVYKRDSARALEGNTFTGFLIYDKEQQAVIGRISAGSCYDSGDSQTGLIIDASERGKMKGREAAILVAGVMHVLYEGQYKVGDKDPHSQLPALLQRQEMIIRP